jgi:hypothetical protein
MNTLAIVLIVVAIVGLVVVAMAVQSLILTLRSLRETVEDLRRETMPVIAELRATVVAANGEIARVDSLLDTAEEVGARVEATSRLAWLVMRNPLIKLASASVATDRRARRLPNRTVTGDPVIPLALEPADDVARARGRASDPARRRSRRAG